MNLFKRFNLTENGVAIVFIWSCTFPALVVLLRSIEEAVPPWIIVVQGRLSLWTVFAVPVAFALFARWMVPILKSNEPKVNSTDDLPVHRQ